MDVQFINSDKNQKLLIQGHLYYKDKVYVEKTYWKCEKFNSKCKARVVTECGNIVKLNNVHNHVADAAQVEANKVVQNIKTLATSTRDPPNYIVAGVSSQISRSVAARLPSVKSLKRTIRSTRKKANIGPAIPLNRMDIVFNLEYTTTEKGENFLLYDSGPEHDRILLFSTARNTQILKTSD